MADPERHSTVCHANISSINDFITRVMSHFLTD
jgi:hypothetical protein